MADYRAMYLHMMRATERAIRILIAAQQDCEEMYLWDGEPDTAERREERSLPPKRTDSPAEDS